MHSRNNGHSNRPRPSKTIALRQRERL